jgi:hypothetical protein
MKAFKMRIQKSSRPLVILLATAVAIITSMVVANATQTITTPNAAFISYNLAAGGNSAPITPATNKSVLVMGCNTVDNPSVGQVSLLHLPSGGMFWVGLEAVGESATTTTITAGSGSTAGTHILWIDAHHLVDIQVASADTIKIHNSNVTQVGSVTLIW